MKQKKVKTCFWRGNNKQNSNIRFSKFKSDEHSGHPSTSKMNVCVATIRELIHKNRHITVCGLVNEVGIVAALFVTTSAVQKFDSSQVMLTSRDLGD
jgi:hypothetical protein